MDLTSLRKVWWKPHTLNWRTPWTPELGGLDPHSNSLKHGSHRPEEGVVEAVPEPLSHLIHILLQFPVLQMAPISEVKVEITAHQLRQIESWQFSLFGSF